MPSRCKTSSTAWTPRDGCAAKFGGAPKKAWILMQFSKYERLTLRQVLFNSTIQITFLCQRGSGVALDFDFTQLARNSAFCW